MKNCIRCIALCALCISFAISSPAADEIWTAHPFYFGALFGYGSTDWNMLVMHCESNDPYCRNDTVGVSAPLDVKNDAGAVWGFTAGYEIKPSWGLEVNYMHFPAVLVQLNAPWNYYMEHGYDITQFSSSTWALYGVAKFMTAIAHTGIRGFANAGIDFTARDDILSDTIHINPTFGIGLNYVLPSRMMVEAVFQYMTGYGTANEIPAQDYIPFLYSLSIKLLYRI